MESLQTELLRNLSSPLSSLILQVVVILISARVCGWVIRGLGQPRVIGEIMAGIFLGPSLLQVLSKDFHSFLFPPSSLQQLYVLGQLGVLLFMFIVGLELDATVLRSRARAAVLISQTSIVTPFLLSLALSFWLFPGYSTGNSGALAFALFMGISLSITAFPVLARILQEKGLMRTPLGAMAITCAAADDVMGWCLLAVVVGLVSNGNGTGSIWTIGLGSAYAGFMLLVVRRFLAGRSAVAMAHSKRAHTKLPSGWVALAFISLLASASITEMIGIHALFGAFLCGVVIPDHNGLKRRLIARTRHVTTLVLLPLFFAYSGLRTQIGLLDDLQSWLVCAAVLCVAILGKFGGTMLAARIADYSWRDSCVLGALMNTRGLMELIVLNIGYDLGILGPKIFTIMVVMAVVTTMMTGPLVQLLLPVVSRPKQNQHAANVLWRSDS
jgi:Kef-type K+ transport system membrane component KefB